MDSDSNELGLVPTQSNQIQLSDISAIEMESYPPKKRKIYKMLTVSERLEMADLFRNFSKGRISHEIKNIAQKYGCSVPTIDREYAAYKKSAEKKQLAICQGAGRPSVPHALSSEMVAGQHSYLADTTHPSSSVLANARGGRNHLVLEVRGKSRHRLPNKRVISHSIPHSAFHDCRRLLSCFDHAGIID